MRIATRVAIGSTLVLLLVGAVVASQRATIARLAAGQRDFGAAELPRITAAFDLLQTRSRLEEYVRKYYVTRDPAYARAAAESAAEVDEVLRRLRSFEAEGPQQVPIRRATMAWRRFPLAGVAPDAAAETLAALAPGDLLAELSEPLEVIRREVTSLLQLAQAAIVREVADATAAAERAQQLSSTAFSAVAILSLLVIVVTVQSINRPLKRLMAATRAVEEGELDHRIDVRSRTELGDLGERFNRMLDRLAEVDRLKRDFVSNVSHEIKTPLVAMEETTRLLLEEVPGPLTDGQRRMLELSLDGQRRLAGMISDLLELSRADAGVMDYHFAPARLEAVVAAAVEAFAPPAADAGVELRLDTAADLPTVVCDRDRITQVIHNLLTNAIRFSPRDGAIDLLVAAGEDGETVAVTVADQGPGVPEPEREAVFDRFRQVGGRRGSANVGLGLAICQEIVAAHGGAIAVTGGAGGGARFRFELPLEPPEDPGTRSAEEES